MTSKSLDLKLYKVSMELSKLERKEREGMPPEQRDAIEESLSNEFVKLQNRYYKMNGFYWNPLMYEGRRMLDENYPRVIT